MVLKTIGTSLLVYTRTLANAETYVVVLNLSTAAQTVDLTAEFPGLRPTLEVIVSSLQSAQYVGG